MLFADASPKRFWYFQGVIYSLTRPGNRVSYKQLDIIRAYSRHFHDFINVNKCSVTLGFGYQNLPYHWSKRDQNTVLVTKEQKLRDICLYLWRHANAVNKPSHGGGLLEAGDLHVFYFKEPSTLTWASGFLKNFFCFLLFY